MRLSEADRRLYSPDRDLAYVTPNLVMAAMYGLDPERLDPWATDLLDGAGVPVTELGAAAGAVGKYLSNLLLPEFKTAHEALAASGFFELPRAAQTVVYAKLGQVLLAVFFCCARDVIKDIDSPPMDLKGAQRAAEEFQAAAVARDRARLAAQSGDPDDGAPAPGFWRRLLNSLSF